MHLNHFESSAEARLKQVLATLKNIHGITMESDFSSDAGHDSLIEYKSLAEEARDRIISESSFNSYQSNPEYIKTMLILEAVRLMLTEIGPKRRRANTKVTVKESRSVEEKKVDQDGDGKAGEFDDVRIARMIKGGMSKGEAIAHVKKKPVKNEELISLPDQPTTDASMDQAPVHVGKDHHYEYQASMARSELYRNAKYAMSMMKQIDPHGEVPPWIAASLTKSATLLDKVYHYLDYYQKFEPEKLPEGDSEPTDLGETSGGVARMNLQMIVEYSTKLFEMIKPGDKLEGWVAMKLTTASEAVSCCKHYMDYTQFEKHAAPGDFLEKSHGMTESKNPLAKAAASMVGPKGADKRDYSDAEWKLLNKVATGNYTGAERAKASELITQSRRPDPKLPESIMEAEDLAKAQTILAAKDMSNAIQDIAEDVAKMAVEDLMPLVDIMRTQYGHDAANAFNEAVKKSLDELLEVTTRTRETVSAAIDTLNEGGIPATSDLETAGDDAVPEPSAGDQSDISADLAALTGADEETDEVSPDKPLGRSKKDEVSEEAVSQDQAVAARIALAAKNKKIPMSQLKGASKQMVSMSKAELEKFAKTDTKDLPKKVSEAAKFITDHASAYEAKHGDSWKQKLYADAWHKYGTGQDQYANAASMVAEGRRIMKIMESALTDHKLRFARHLAEGKVTDPLHMGYGLQGDAIIAEMQRLEQTISATRNKMRKIMQEGVMGMLKQIELLNKTSTLESEKSATPYGVIYTSKSGSRARKMFESADERAYWLELKGESIVDPKLIEPETFDRAIDRLMRE